MGFLSSFTSIFDDDISSGYDSENSDFDWGVDNYNLVDSGDTKGFDSGSSAVDSMFGLDDYDYSGGSSGSSDKSWWEKATDLATSPKGLGLIGSFGAQALNYMNADKAQENALAQLAAKNAYEMELLKLKASLASGGSSGGGGGGGGTDQYSHNAGIKALADKYPVDENFKRS